MASQPGGTLETYFSLTLRPSALNFIERTDTENAKSLSETTIQSVDTLIELQFQVIDPELKLRLEVQVNLLSTRDS